MKKLKDNLLEKSTGAVSDSLRAIAIAVESREKVPQVDMFDTTVQMLNIKSVEVPPKKKDKGCPACRARLMNRIPDGYQVPHTHTTVKEDKPKRRKSYGNTTEC